MAEPAPSAETSSAEASSAETSSAGASSAKTSSAGASSAEASSAELSALRAWLDHQREHVLGILEGLSEDDLRRPVLPSGWTCLGLVNHLALDVERFWFRAVAAGERVTLPDGDAAWRVSPDLPAEAVFDRYREEIALADAVLTRTALDAPPVWWPSSIFPDLPPRDLRNNILAVITETASHAGHLDAVRELIDGRTWLVLT